MNVVPASPDQTGTSREIRKSITFTGAAGLGATGAVPIFVITGAVMVERILGRCTTNLSVAAGATIALGVTGQTSLFIAATGAVAILTSAACWATTTPTAGGIALPAATLTTVINANIIGTVAVNPINSGVIEFYVEYVPLSADGALV